MRPVLLGGSQALGFCEAPANNIDFKRCYKNKVELCLNNVTLANIGIVLFTV